jgi:hypothetical protein
MTAEELPSFDGLVFGVCWARWAGHAEHALGSHKRLPMPLHDGMLREGLVISGDAACMGHAHGPAAMDAWAGQGMPVHTTVCCAAKQEKCYPPSPPPPPPADPHPLRLHARTGQLPHTPLLASAQLYPAHANAPAWKIAHTCSRWLCQRALGPPQGATKTQLAAPRPTADEGAVGRDGRAVGQGRAGGQAGVGLLLHRDAGGPRFCFATADCPAGGLCVWPAGSCCCLAPTSCTA